MIISETMIWLCESLLIDGTKIAALCQHDPRISEIVPYNDDCLAFPVKWNPGYEI